LGKLDRENAMSRFDGRWALTFALLAATLATLWLLQRAHRTAPPLDDWDVPQLVAYLNRQGLKLRVVPVPKEGPESQGVFLTSTEHEWSYFNRLFKDPRHIERWQGTLYCEWGDGPQGVDLDTMYGDCYYRAGPFFFFGDRALLKQVHAALTDPAVQTSTAF
jgi:hypothetical protein